MNELLKLMEAAGASLHTNGNGKDTMLSIKLPNRGQLTLRFQTADFDQWYLNGSGSIELKMKDGTEYYAELLVKSNP